jgi:hypothetical protein
MSTSVLYHCFWVIGRVAHHVCTRFEKGCTVFKIDQEPTTFVCSKCGSRAVTRKKLRHYTSQSPMSLRSAHREIRALTARRASHQLSSHAGFIAERYGLLSASLDRSAASQVGAILSALHYCVCPRAGPAWSSVWPGQKDRPSSAYRQSIGKPCS